MSPEDFYECTCESLGLDLPFSEAFEDTFCEFGKFPLEEFPNSSRLTCVSSEDDEEL
jgi:hypothetical protein